MKTLNKKIFISTITLVCCLCSCGHAEIIRLKNGQVIEGGIAERLDDAVKVDSGTAGIITYYLDEIESVDGVPAVSSKPETEEDLGQEGFLVISGEVIRENEPMDELGRYAQVFFVNGREIARKKFKVSFEQDNSVPELLEMTGVIPDGVVKEYYPDGALMAEIFYRDGQENGLARAYYQSGAVMMEANNKDGRADGFTKGFYESGALKAESDFQRGIGKWYYEDGALKSEMDRDKGIFNAYDEDGTLLGINYTDDGASGQ